MSVFKRAEWHSGLTYRQTCRECKTVVEYTDHKLDFRPWYADGFVYCPKCETPLRHSERYALEAPEKQEIASVTAGAQLADASVAEGRLRAEQVPAEEEAVQAAAIPTPIRIRAEDLDRTAVLTEIPPLRPVAVEETAAPDNEAPKQTEALSAFCHRCGKKFREDDIFCSGCGTKRR